MTKKAKFRKLTLKDTIRIGITAVIMIWGASTTIISIKILQGILTREVADAFILKKILWYFTFTTTGLTIIGIFVGLFIAAILSKGITRSIDKLRKGIQIIAGGDLDYQIDITTSDEIGELARAFNHMTGELKEAWDKLELEKRSLEQKVHERTEELSKANIELKMRSEELEAVNQELESFTYTASHDLKEPLRGIETFSQFLLEDYQDKLDDTGKDYLKRVRAAANRMQNLIDDLLALSRISRIKNPYQSVDSGKLAKEAIKQLKSIIEEKNVVVEVDDELPYIWCDPVKMKEVFYNLIANGIKYNDKDKPAIEIGVEQRTRRAEDRAEVTFFVKDNGIGIKEEHFGLVFEMFKRIGGGEKYGGGTGAGGAIVKKIIEEHKGKIWIKSEEGKGSTFFFTIPKTSYKE